MAYLPLSTANLPDPAIDPAQGSSPADYFNTVLTESTGSTLSVDVGFAADFLWTKARNFARSHELHDRVRGDNKRLKSDATTAEESYSNYVVFDADGADLGTNHNLGYHADGTTTGVVWAWKANGSGVSNTDGSITSTVSANTTSGFSIVKWTSESSTAEIGHGLGVIPDMIIIKNRDASQDWRIAHVGLPDMTYHMNFTTQQSFQSGTAIWNGAPTSTVFKTGTDASVGGTANNDMIAYCFHSVEGFSKFGSYISNGSNDGPFIYTGFRVAFVLIKRTIAGDNWVIYDSARDTYNVADAELYPNTSGVEASTQDIDFLSNGFKIRSSGGLTNGTTVSTYIYMAFAENPFKYSNAR